MLRKRINAFLMLAFLLGGCGAIPGAGPFRNDIDDSADATLESGAGSEQPALRYALLDVSQQVISSSERYDATSANQLQWPALERPEDIRVSIGDTLNITIYEAKTGGLFIPQEAGVRPGNFVNFPAQSIDHTGAITVPYAGAIPVVGKTLAEIERVIVDKLKERAIDPQVLVTFAERGGSQVSVIGAVNNATRYPLNFGGERILDAIARAGGPRSPGYETFVVLQRGGEELTIPLDALVQDPQKNIYLKPKDTLYLYREPSMYMVFGAAINNGRHEFEKRTIFLSEAIGKANGLRSSQADPGVVFVYRRSSKQLLKELALKLDGLGWDQLEEEIPTIYRFNLREPNGLFLTQRFAVKNNDIVYIPDADTINLQKFLQILTPGSSTVLNVQHVN